VFSGFERIHRKSEVKEVNIREELYYVYEKDTYIQNKLGIRKNHMIETINAVYDACRWLDVSCFSGLLDNLRIEIIDTPIIDAMALIGINDNDNEILLFINVTHVVYYFEKERYDEIFRLNKLSCYEFAAFVFLHEIGHLVHACLQNPGGNLIEEKLRIYLNENKKNYNRYKKWIQNSKYYRSEEKENLSEHIMVHRKYRELPGEKQADNFAKRYLRNVLEFKKGR